MSAQLRHRPRPRSGSRSSEFGIDPAREGWLVTSMKDDWRVIFPDDAGQEPAPGAQ